MVSDEEIEKMNSGKIATFKVDGPPQQSVYQLTPSMSRDLYNISEVIRDDVREVLGFSRNQAGDFDVSRRTATEASIVQQAIQIRSDERRDIVADFIAASFQRKVNPMVFAFWTGRRTIEVTGLAGWVPFTGPEIKGDYSVSVVADSTLPMTKAQRRADAAALYGMFNGDPFFDQMKLRQYVLEQFEGVVPEDLMLSPEEFQQQQQQAAAEEKANALVQALSGGGERNGPSRLPVQGMRRNVRVPQAGG
jgi:hypothetical protein